MRRLRGSPSIALLIVRLPAFIAVLCVGVAAQAANPPARLSVLETPNTNFRGLGKKLGAALAAEGFVIVAPRVLAAAARAQNLTLGHASELQLQVAAKAAGIDVFVRVKITGTRGAFVIELAADSADTRIFTKRVILGATPFDAALARDLAHAIAAARENGAHSDSPDLAFSPADPVVGDDELTTEEAEDDEDLDPDTHHGRTAPSDRFTATASLVMLERSAQTSAAFGRPPHYDGALSPGVGVALAAFPARAGVAHDFGAFVRGVAVFMPSELGSPSYY